MKLFCVACFDRTAIDGVDRETSLCAGCQQKLVTLQTQAAQDHGAVYEYRDLMRELILRVKIGGDYAAMATLVALAAKNFPRDVAAILMPAASSLWGRLRGRFDLAAVLASGIARIHNLTVHHPPRELYWRFHKSSLLTRHKRLNDLTPAFVPTLKEISKNEDPSEVVAVLMDDITTTGATYHRHAEACSEAQPNMKLHLWALAWTPTHRSCEDRGETITGSSS